MERIKLNLRNVEVFPCLPHHRGPDFGDPLPPGIIGSRIVKFGTVAKDVATRPCPSLEGGGLVIHYIPEGETQVQRVAFSFTELGMALAYPEEWSQDPILDIPPPTGP
jgi:hypothetical protein